MGDHIRYIDYIYSKMVSSCTRYEKFLSKNAESSLTVCLMYIFIEEFSQVDVFLRGKIEQVTLVCL